MRNDLRFDAEFLFDNVGDDDDLDDLDDDLEYVESGEDKYN